MYSNPLRVGAAALAAVICAPGLITQAAAADISSIKPGVANVGQTVRLKSGTTVPAGARLAVDLRVGAGKRVRLKAKRVAGKRIAVSLTKALGKLMVGNTDVTRVRLRLVVNGKPGRWSRRALLVPGSGGSPGSGGGSNDGSPGGGGGGGGGAPGTDAPPNPSPSLGIPVVRDSDFSYLGSFAMPIDSGCGGWETAWPSAGLSLRRVDGDLR
ncbi:MAG: hypothetical protein Q8P61_00265, partial [Candidatus Nanopelagicales bacterium]|nr:hypothetical protein [Candidatus Nanopelagicales bacterium]